MIFHRRRKRIFTWHAVIGALALSGCRLAPEDVRPDAGAQKTVVVPPGPVISKWWGSFHDARLNALIEAALEKSPTVIDALSKVREARAKLAVVDAGFYPTAKANGAFSRSQASSSVPNVVNGTNNTWTAGGTLAYEVDLWGRVRNLADAADADFRASVGDWESAKLTLAGDVASAWFTWKAARIEREIILKQIEWNVGRYNALYSRMVLGASAGDDVERAKFDLARLRLDLEECETRAETTRVAVLVLIGEPPDRPLSAPSVEEGVPPEFPHAIPSTTLLHRPDVYAADMRVGAALHREGATRADYYPNVQLTATGGYTALNAGSLFDSGSKFWSFGPSVTLPIFSGFKTDADMESARAEFERSWAGYRQTLLTAFKEVQEALIRLDSLDRRDGLLRQQSDAGEKTMNIIERKYSGGAASFMELSIARRDHLDSERARIVARLERYNQIVKLYKAAGGGWTRPEDRQAAVEKIGERLETTNAAPMDSNTKD